MIDRTGVFRVIVFTLLVGETAGLVYFLSQKGPDARSEFRVEPRKKYSLLVDNERFPIPTKPGETIVVTLETTEEPANPPTDQRVIIEESEAQLKMSTPSKSRWRFYFDLPASLARFREQEHLERLRGASDWATVLNVMGWSRSQFEPGTPREYPSQNAVELLKVLRSKQEEGFCAQYCYITVQALQALGFKARYVTIIGHEVAEVWVPSLKKWVLLDTLNKIHFEDDSGRKLSAIEIFRQGAHAHAVPPSSAATANPKRYRLLAFWLHNDLFTTPINFYDLTRYQVVAILDPADAENIQTGDLCTFYPDEMYLDPNAT